MTRFSKAPRKPLLNVEQGKVFISQLDNDLHKGIAKNIFVDGMTNAEVADDYFYCERQVQRIRIGLLKTVLIKLIEKQIPKKPYQKETCYYPNVCKTGVCPNCHIKEDSWSKYCRECGQALDWGDDNG